MKIVKDKGLTLAEACRDVLGCSYSKGLRLMKAGQLPGKKVGSTYLIPQAALYESLGLRVPGDEE